MKITLERDDDDGQKLAAALTLHTNPESSKSNHKLLEILANMATSEG